MRRGIGSMDYIETLLIMEDDLDETEDLGQFLDNHPAKNQNNDLSQMMDYLLVKAHMIQIQQVVPLIGVFVANATQCLKKSMPFPPDSQNCV